MRDSPSETWGSFSWFVLLSPHPSIWILVLHTTTSKDSLSNRVSVLGCTVQAVNTSFPTNDLKMGIIFLYMCICSLVKPQVMHPVYQTCFRR